jgi:HPt (histidine-containing phosphotransfer) domain-containing protein
MLIYNYKKEFLGIDESDLKNLGFSNLAQLRTEAADFADLFVRTPGYVHNFRHVHWIDFIECADSNEDSKVIMHVKNKNYKCTLGLSTAYLVDNPSSKAYLVQLQNIKELTKQESEQIAADLRERPAPKTAISGTPIFNTPEFNGDFETTDFDIEKPHSYKRFNDSPLVVDEIDTTSHIIEDEYEETFLPATPFMAETTQVFDKYEKEDTVVKEEENFKLDIDLEEDEKEPLPLQKVPEVALITKEEEKEEEISAYVYDPHVASDELGLPVDLIEEFIQDFINQAKEFKDGLYQSLSLGEMDNVKIQSHKLKGVAANLRIEDAFETLSIINTSSDTNEILSNLNRFYKIVSKLAGEKIETLNISPIIKEDGIVEDDLPLELKDNNDDDDEDLYMDQQINDSEVPFKIEMPELADDLFLDQTEKLNQDLEKDLELIDLQEFDEEDLKFEESEELQELNHKEEKIEIEIEEETEEKIEEEKKPVAHFLYNKYHAASEIGIDLESFEELLKDYIHDTEQLSKAMQTAIEADDYSSLKNYTIQIKGMSDSMKVHEFTPELETLLETKDATIAKIALDKINTFISYIKTEGSKK